MRIVGGAGFYFEGRALSTLKWPWMVLTVDGAGVRLDARFRAADRIVRLLHQVPFSSGFLEQGFVVGDPWWAADWHEVIAVEFAVGDVAFFSTSPFEMRFRYRADDLEALYDLVPLDKVYPPTHDVV